MFVAKDVLSRKSQEELLLEESLFGSTAAAKLASSAVVSREADNTDSDISVADPNDMDADEEDSENAVEVSARIAGGVRRCGDADVCSPCGCSSRSTRSRRRCRARH